MHMLLYFVHRHCANACFYFQSFQAAGLYNCITDGQPLGGFDFLHEMAGYYAVQNSSEVHVVMNRY